MQEVAEMAAEKQMQMQMQMQAATATAATANQLSGGVSVALSEAKTDWSGAYVVEPRCPECGPCPGSCSWRTSTTPPRRLNDPSRSPRAR